MIRSIDLNNKIVPFEEILKNINQAPTLWLSGKYDAYNVCHKLFKGRDLEWAMANDEYHENTS